MQNNTITTAEHYAELLAQLATRLPDSNDATITYDVLELCTCTHVSDAYKLAELAEAYKKVNSYNARRLIESAELAVVHKKVTLVNVEE